jgi:NAD(P)-dependent dehydrogenase (short-subunit alcohol dehydrogenase family)
VKTGETSVSKKQVIFITGTSHGFGANAAKALAHKGHRVYATMRAASGRNRERADELREFAESNGAFIEVLNVDVTSTAEVTDAVAHMLAKEGRVDVAINNAGYFLAGISEGFTVEAFSELLNTNVLGCFRVNQAVLPAMREQRSGLLIHVGSVAGRIVLPFTTLYHVSKFAVEALTEGLHYELSQLGVESVVVEPGVFATNIFTTSAGPTRQHVITDYGAVNEGMGAIIKNFGEALADEEATDSKHVANVLIELVEMAPGTRPLRTTVGGDMGVGALNEVIEPLRTGPLNAMGLGHMEKVITGE